MGDIIAFVVMIGLVIATATTMNKRTGGDSENV